MGGGAPRVKHPAQGGIVVRHEGRARAHAWYSERVRMLRCMQARGWRTGTLTWGEAGREKDGFSVNRTLQGREWPRCVQQERPREAASRHWLVLAVAASTLSMDQPAGPGEACWLLSCGPHAAPPCLLTCARSARPGTGCCAGAGWNECPGSPGSGCSSASARGGGRRAPRARGKVSSCS